MMLILWCKRHKATIQKLYKEMPQVLIVVEDTMEDNVLNIFKVMKGFQENIEDLQLQSTLGTPLDVWEGRYRMAMTKVTNMKKIEEECAEIYKDNAQIWNDLVKYL